MNLVLDPNKNFVEIRVFFVEETKPQGTTIFHFINNKEDMSRWRGRGYVTQSEAAQMSKPADTPSPPGMPAKKFDPTKVIKEMKTYWRRMTWKDQNSIFSRCLRTMAGPGGKMSTELDGILFRDAKLKKCLVKWDVRDDEGNEIPLTESIIDNLDPSVADALLGQYEMVTEVSSEDLKN